MDSPFKKELLYSRIIIQARVKELAGQISKDYSDREPILLGVLKGAVFFFADLVREMTISSRIDFIRAASYGSPVILVEDIVDTGLTVTKILKILKEQGPESIKVCALIDKLERRNMDIVIDYCGFQVKEGFLIGYGLDYNEQYRYLPDIYTIR